MRTGIIEPKRALGNAKSCGAIRLELQHNIRGAKVVSAWNCSLCEVMEDHIRFHVVDPARERDPDKAKGAEELIDVVRAYLK